MSRKMIHTILTPVSVLCFAVITFGFDVVSRIDYRNLSASDAIAEAWNEPAANLFGIVLLALPVIGAQLLAVEFARVTSFAGGAVLLILSLGLLAWPYFGGYSGYQEALAMNKWTDAALSIGLLPLKGGALLLIPLLVSVVMSRRWKSTSC